MWLLSVYAKHKGNPHYVRYVIYFSTGTFPTYIQCIEISKTKKIKIIIIVYTLRVIIIKFYIDTYSVRKLSYLHIVRGEATLVQRK